MLPIDLAFAILKRQTTLGEWDAEFPSEHGPVKWYHGSHNQVRPLIHQQGLVPQNELANNEDWFRQLDFDPEHRITDEEWEKMVAEHEPTTSFTPDKTHAYGFGNEIWGIRGNPEGIYTLQHDTPIESLAYDSNYTGGSFAPEFRTKQTIPPEQLVYLGEGQWGD